ncbi:MAG TPA: WD40 repeat domain-containing protein, partial [Verrucomicrobiota bacterium]|nr:WD40 repeat domain-containing protein [Verrucomicrobiota bacterium]
PARRYRSARALADDLQRWLDGEPISARPASRVERIGKWVRRRPAWAALYATVAASLLALGVGSVLFTAQVMRARTVAENANRDLRHNLFVREWQEAETLAAQDKVGGALLWFARALREKPDDLALATRLVSLLSEHSFALPHRPPLTNDAPVLSARLSPDDARLVTADAAGRVRCWSVAEGKRIWTLPRNFDQPGAAFVAGGQAVVVVDRGSVSLWPAEGGPGPLREVGGLEVSLFDFSADGRRLAFSGPDQRAEVWDTETLRRVSEGPVGEDGHPVFLRLSRDGRRLLRNHGSELRVHDSATGRWLWRGQPALEPSGWYYAKGDFTGDGERIVGVHMAGVPRGQLAVWPITVAPEGTPKPSLDERPAWSVPAFAESAGVLVAGDSSRALVWTRSGLLNGYALASGKRLLEPVEHTGAVVGVVEAATGEWVVAAADRTLHFWDFAMKTPAPRVHLPGKVANGARFGPDLNWFTLCGDGVVGLFNSDDGQPRRIVNLPGRVRDLDLSRDGRRMVATSAHVGVMAWDTQTGAELFPMQPQAPLFTH